MKNRSVDFLKVLIFYCTLIVWTQKISQKKFFWQNYKKGFCQIERKQELHFIIVKRIRAIIEIVIQQRIFSFLSFISCERNFSSLGNHRILIHVLLVNFLLDSILVLLFLLYSSKFHYKTKTITWGIRNSIDDDLHDYIYLCVFVHFLMWFNTIPKMLYDFSIYLSCLPLLSIHALWSSGIINEVETNWHWKTFYCWMVRIM